MRRQIIFGFKRFAFRTFGDLHFSPDFTILPVSNIFRVGFSTKQEKGSNGFNPKHQNVAFLAFGFSYLLTVLPNTKRTYEV